jgi:DNA-binding transcriptional MerR regulator
VNSEKVAAIAQVSYRQMDFWLRRGWVPNPPEEKGIGVPRVWNDDHVEFFRRMGLLTRAGVYPEKAHRIAKGEDRAAEHLLAAVARCQVADEASADAGQGSPDPTDVGAGAEPVGPDEPRP